MRFEPVLERLLGDPVTGVLGALELLSTLRVLKSRPNSAPIFDDARDPARGESREEGDDGSRPLDRIDETRLLSGRRLGGLFDLWPWLLRFESGRLVGGVPAGGGGGAGGSEVLSSGGKGAATTGLTKLFLRACGEPVGALCRSAFSNSAASTAGSRKFRLPPLAGVVVEPRRTISFCELLCIDPFREPMADRDPADCLDGVIAEGDSRSIVGAGGATAGAGSGAGWVAEGRFIGGGFGPFTKPAAAAFAAGG